MISSYLIKKWFKMMFGLSNMYVPQPAGRNFSKDKIRGYYNDLTNKVKREKKPFGSLPTDEETRKTTEFPIQVFQYGLGSYDCFLDTNNARYLETVFACAKFALINQQKDGGWITFKGSKNPYSSMAQGEGISLLSRAFVLTNDQVYRQAACKAFEFMKKVTMKQTDSGPVFYEFVDKPVVLNGWIFSIFGVFDYSLLTGEDSDCQFFLSCIDKLEKSLANFDNGKWSLYREDGRYVSRFYMGVHIAQMQALYRMTGHQIYNDYSLKWSRYLHNPFRRTVYFWKKAFQKIKEKP